MPPTHFNKTHVGRRQLRQSLNLYNMQRILLLKRLLSIKSLYLGPIGGLTEVGHYKSLLGVGTVMFQRGASL